MSRHVERPKDVLPDEPRNLHDDIIVWPQFHLRAWLPLHSTTVRQVLSRSFCAHPCDGWWSQRPSLFRVKHLGILRQTQHCDSWSPGDGAVPSRQCGTGHHMLIRNKFTSQRQRYTTGNFITMHIRVLLKHNSVCKRHLGDTLSYWLCSIRIPSNSLLGTFPIPMLLKMWCSDFRNVYAFNHFCWVSFWYLSPSISSYHINFSSYKFKSTNNTLKIKH